MDSLSCVSPTENILNSLLELTDVRVRFRTLSTTRAILNGVSDPFVDAVNGVSLEIKEGETYGLLERADQVRPQLLVQLSVY